MLFDVRIMVCVQTFLINTHILDIAGFRYTDIDSKCISMERDISEESTCHIHSPPLYCKGPKIAMLISQYGLE